MFHVLVILLILFCFTAGSLYGALKMRSIIYKRYYLTPKPKISPIADRTEVKAENAEALYR